MLFDLLEKEGVGPSALERVSVPIGLHIGTETPEEIGLSIAAELIAVRKSLDIRGLKSSLHRGNTPGAQAGP